MAAVNERCEQCGKTAWRHRQSAENAMAAFRRKGLYLTKEGRLHVYRCPHKNGWHFGHTHDALDTDM